MFKFFSSLVLLLLRQQKIHEARYRALEVFWIAVKLVVDVDFLLLRHLIKNVRDAIAPDDLVPVAAHDKLDVLLHQEYVFEW